MTCAEGPDTFTEDWKCWKYVYFFPPSVTLVLLNDAGPQVLQGSAPPGSALLATPAVIQGAHEMMPFSPATGLSLLSQQPCRTSQCHFNFTNEVSRGSSQSTLLWRDSEKDAESSPCPWFDNMNSAGGDSKTTFGDMQSKPFPPAWFWIS